MNPHLPSLLFYENEAVAHRLQPSKNMLLFAYNFCQGQTFSRGFFPARAITR